MRSVFISFLLVARAVFALSAPTDSVARDSQEISSKKDDNAQLQNAEALDSRLDFDPFDPCTLPFPPPFICPPESDSTTPDPPADDPPAGSSRQRPSRR
ncbi:hypothetical protein BCR43DRAFT_121676 [Syncephalastrum racemosum]|uniref:Uncharacterized protein n=1 Tax=Syncephalastrum racemosum TaxID=13706 RepID=A0A1X2GZ64_SYNRA|nr:hypothetical protein BCR43DRAFT_121676 [Syncephalastrum racemosum]